MLDITFATSGASMTSVSLLQQVSPEACAWGVGVGMAIGGTALFAGAHTDAKPNGYRTGTPPRDPHPV